MPKSKKIKETKNGPKPNGSCAEIKTRVDHYLQKKCTNKFNTVEKCNDCSIKNEDWPVINSPFDANLLNTGHDGAGGIIASGAGTDLHWEAGVGTTAGPASVGSWIPAFVKKDTAWTTSPFNNANWISVFPDTGHKGNVDVYFKNQFYLNSSINPSQFFLDMRFFADNSVYEIYINGVPQSGNYASLLPQNSSNPYGHVGFSANADVHIKLEHDWEACENEIIVHVKSGKPKVGFLAQNFSKCSEAEIPSFTPVINIKWGDSECDCIESNDTEVMCLTVCNYYSNVTFTGFTIHSLQVCDENGNPVPLLPDGNPSVELVPRGPYCFGDIAPCSCISREFIILNKGAKAGKYKIKVQGICYDVCLNFADEDCFEFEICKD